MLKLAVLLGERAGDLAVHRARRRAAPSSPAHILNWLIQALPNAHGTESFSILERAFLLAFDLRVGIIIPASPGSDVRVCSSAFRLGPHDLERVAIALEHGCATGYGTGTAPDTSSMFLPLCASGTVVGALGIAADVRLPYLADPGTPLFRAFCGQAVLSIVRARLYEQSQRARLLQETDRLQKALLSSLSHNVRTPIASIIGSLSTLRDAPVLDEPTRRDLIDNAITETERLNRLMGNLLDLGRLEAGRLQVRRDPCDVQDIIGAALEQLGSAAAYRSLRLEIQPDLPFVRLDFVLIVQVMVNLLDNALKYSSEQDEIIVEAAVQCSRLRVSVLDSGEGIPETEISGIFEKFNRAGRTGETGGLGLGLSICRGLVEAHHGTIWAERRQPRGTILTFSIPVN